MPGRWRRAVRAALAAGLVLLAAAGPAAAFHFPWDQGHDTTNPADPPPPGPCEGPTCDDDCGGNATRSPVYAAQGHAVWRDIDVVLRGRPYLGVQRAYNSNDPVLGLFGNGWSVCFDVALFPANRAGTALRIYRAANGKRFVYERQADGSFKAPAGRFETLVEGPGGATLTALDGRRSVFAADGRLVEQLDANGNRTSYTHDAWGRPTRIADEAGRWLALSYNGAGFVDEVADHGGRRWQYRYDATGNLVGVIDPAGGVQRYTWQPWRPPGDAQTYWQLLSAVDAAGVNKVRFTYAGGRVASWSDRADTFTYTRPAANTAAAGTVSRRDAVGASTSFAYGPLGLVTRDTDGLGGITAYTYDGNGRMTTVVDPLGRAWTAAYDALGRMTRSANPLGEATALQYAGNDPRPRRLTSPLGRVTAMTYDARGNLATVTDPSGAVTRTVHDTRGDMVRVTNALGETARIEVDARGQPLRVTDALGRVTTMAYDVLGRVASHTDPGGHTTRYGWDALDRMTGLVDALGQTTSYAYDAAGRLLAVTDARGSVTRWEYDGFGRRIAEVAPDGRRTAFAWRADNLLERITWPDGTTVAWQYDADKRVVRETAGSDVITFAYDAAGQLTSASGPGGVVAYSWDGAGRVIGETSGTQSASMQRNADGERVQLDILGRRIAYTRDMRGLVTRIDSPAGAFGFEFDALGRRSRLTYPNGATASTTFDAAGQLTQLAHAGVFEATYVHRHDAAGRLLHIDGDGPGWQFAHDALGRLQRATRGLDDRVFELDAVGNVLGNGRVVDVNHRLLSDAERDYTWDRRGNLVLERHRASGARTAYAWNARNQLLRVDEYANGTATVPVRTLQYTYDPLGRRASRTDNGVAQRFVHDAQDLVGVLDAAGAVQAFYVHGLAIDEPLAAVAGPSVRLLHADHLGSVRAVVQDGVLTHAYAYAPYGAALPGSSPDSVPFRFTGREKDTDRLYHYRARYYSVALERFIGEDPLGVFGGLNLYGYAAADPTAFTDPSGEIPLIPIGAAYGRCVLQCMAWSAAGQAVTGGLNCWDLGREAGDCAMSCLNPLNWAGKRAKGFDPPGIAPKQPRADPRKLRREWEQRNGEPWPKTDTGRNYDAHHKKPLADGGTNDPSNIEPMHPADHRQHHIDNGDFSRWGGRRRP